MLGMQSEKDKRNACELQSLKTKNKKNMVETGGAIGLLQ
jgi:hypothetical protein